MHSLTTQYLEQLSYQATDLSTIRTIGEYQGKQELFFQQSPETLNSLRLLAKIESSESSNRLEGIELAHKKIEELILNDTSPTTRSEQEIAGYRDVLNLIHESGKDIPFTSNVILQFHNVLCRYLPNLGGRWKSTNNEIIETNADGTKRIRFTPTQAYLVPQAMEALTQNYQQAIQAQRYDPLVIIPLTVFDFLCIHPFSDGNGRLSRLITLQLLYHFGYQVGRYISLERIFEESKMSYYETLESSSQGWHQGKHNIKPWLNYFWGVLLKAYKEFEERVGAVNTVYGSKSEMVRNTVKRKLIPFSINDIAAECPGISRDMIRRVLRQMRDEGLIKPTSSGRGAMWEKLNI